MAKPLDRMGPVAQVALVTLRPSRNDPELGTDRAYPLDPK
jgi:hypothetical protein